MSPAQVPAGLEALRELAAEAGAESARAVGRLMGGDGSLEDVAAFDAADAAALATLAGSLGRELVAVGMDLAGPLPGRIVLLVGSADAERIATTLVPSAAAGSLDALGESAVVEAGNIAGSAFVSSLARRLARPLLHGVPRLTRGSPAGCVADLAGRLAGPALVPTFRCAGLRAVLLFLPDAERMTALVAAREAR